MEPQLEIAITILSALLTGGFILFFIENQHIEKEVADNFKSIMNPYYNKLGDYLRFVYFISGRLRFKVEKDSYVEDYKKIVDYLSGIGGKLYVSSKNVGFKTATELEDLNEKINHIWYLDDKGWFVQQQISIDSLRTYIYSDQDIYDALMQLSTKYKDVKIDTALLPKVSGDFYVQFWQPVQFVTHRYEFWQQQTSKLHFLLNGSIFLVMAVLLCTLFFVNHQITDYISVLTLLSCLVFAFTLYRFGVVRKLSQKLFD